MTTKLALVTKATRHLGQERPVGLTDDTQAVREILAVYDETVAEALEGGLWLWALRTVHITADADIEPAYGRTYGYTLPDDFVRISNISNSPHFEGNGELDYDLTGPGRTLYADEESFYLRYVSDDADYGMNLGAWPETFAEGVGYALAFRSAIPIAKDRGDRNDLMTLAERWYAKAKIRNAVDERVKSKPTGRLVRSRFANPRRGGSLRDSMR